MQERQNKKKLKELKARLDELNRQYQEANEGVGTKNCDINELMDKLKDKQANIDYDNELESTLKGGKKKEREINYDAV